LAGFQFVSAEDDFNEMDDGSSGTAQQVLQTVYSSLSFFQYPPRCTVFATVLLVLL